MRYKILYVLLLSATVCLPLHDALARIKTTSPRSHEAVKAEVIDSDPAHFTIDVHKASNMGVNEEAPTFAIYTSEEPPKTCGDFSTLDLKYEKPEKHKRVFNLSDHKDVLKALKKYHCVVVKNKAS